MYLATAFAHPDTFDGPALDEPVDRASLDAVFEQIATVTGFRRYIGRRNGEVAGAAGMRISDGVAQLCGAATLPSIDGEVCKRRCSSNGSRTPRKRAATSPW